MSIAYWNSYLWDLVAIYLILLNMRDVFSCIFGLIAILFDVNPSGRLLQACSFFSLFSGDLLHEAIIKKDKIKDTSVIWEILKNYNDC